GARGRVGNRDNVICRLHRLGGAQGGGWHEVSPQRAFAYAPEPYPLAGEALGDGHGPDYRTGGCAEVVDLCLLAAVRLHAEELVAGALEPDPAVGGDEGRGRGRTFVVAGPRQLGAVRLHSVETVVEGVDWRI